MNMHYLTYVFIPNDADADEAVATALQPFSEEIEVKPWKRYLDSEEIARMAKCYGVPKTSSRKLAGYMEAWNGGLGGVDERGLFAIHSYNPQAKWDWYEIGGRWQGTLPNNEASATSLLESPKLKEILPHDFLTPDGKWHQKATFIPQGFFGGRFRKKSDAKWLEELTSALTTYVDYRIVCVDIHG